MELDVNNYYSVPANQQYLSVSQYKEFIGSLGKEACEEQALAKLSGDWTQDKTVSLLMGSFIDAYFEGSLNLFAASNPEIYTNKGVLKAEYRKAEEIIERIERDKYFMKFLSGRKQVIMTAKIYGVDWKIKMDSYLENICITDLKIMKSLREYHYIKEYGYMDFTRYWGYDIQGAIYQEVVYQNTGKRLPFYIAAASKEKEPDIEIIQIDNKHLQEKIYEIEQNTPKIIMLKNRQVEPIRCGICDWCRHTKILSKPIHYSELLGEL